MATNGIKAANFAMLMSILGLFFVAAVLALFSFKIGQQPDDVHPTDVFQAVKSLEATVKSLEATVKSEGEKTREEIRKQAPADQ